MLEEYEIASSIQKDIEKKKIENELKDYGS